MEDPYACIICWHKLTEPIVLNCGHTFDKKCTKELESCPICRTEILSRSTNWQVLQIMESRTKTTALEPSSSDEPETEEKYCRITDWSTLKRGARLKYIINSKSQTPRYGWFSHFDLEEQVAEIYFHKAKSIRLPIEYIQEAWHHPDLMKEPFEYKRGCCHLV